MLESPYIIGSIHFCMLSFFYIKLLQILLCSISLSTSPVSNIWTEVYHCMVKLIAIQMFFKNIVFLTSLSLLASSIPLFPASAKGELSTNSKCDWLRWFFSFHLCQGSFKDVTVNRNSLKLKAIYFLNKTIRKKKNLDPMRRNFSAFHFVTWFKKLPVLPS